MSRIGKKPVAIPKDVKIETKGGQVCVEGPKGKLSLTLSNGIEVDVGGQTAFNHTPAAELEAGLLDARSGAAFGGLCG